MDNCGKCYYCREKGLMRKCLDLKKYGHESCAPPPHSVGGFAEYCYVMPGTCVIKIPDELPDEVAASANCALATVVAGWDAARLQRLSLDRRPAATMKKARRDARRAFELLLRLK